MNANSNKGTLQIKRVNSNSQSILLKNINLKNV